MREADVRPGPAAYLLSDLGPVILSAPVFPFEKDA